MATTTTIASKMAAHLTESEDFPDFDFDEMVERYHLNEEEVEKVNELKQRWEGEGNPPPPPPASDFKYVKVLCARKWDVDRAEALLPAYLDLWNDLCEGRGFVTREERDAANMDELMGSYGRDKKFGVIVLYYDCDEFIPSEHVMDDLLRFMMFTIEEVFQRDESTLRNGLVLIANMKNLGWKNFSLEMESAFTSFIQNRYPARLRAMYGMDPPWIINAIMTMMSPFMGKKLKSKINMLPQAEILELVGADAIPPNGGGTFDPNNPDAIANPEDIDVAVDESTD